MRAMTFAGLVLSLMVVAFAPSAATAEPAAIVLEVVGPVEPTLRPFAELSEGESYRLGSSTQLTFVHYRTCRVVSIVGGTVRLEHARYGVSGGRIENEQLRPCPQQYVLAPARTPAGTTGALLLRSGATEALTVSARPDVIVTGARAEAFAAIEVRRHEFVVALVPVGARRFVWPRNRDRLTAAEGYRLVLSRTAGARAEIPFTVLDGSAPADFDRLLIIRAD